MSISIIAAIANNNVIGNNNQLIWHIPADMKHFKETTSGHPIIMGKKTFESIGRPLPNRRNIVITRDQNYTHEGVEVFHSLDEVLNLFKGSTEEAFVIGGGEIYRQAIDQADKLYITHIHATFEGDTFFPPINEIIWNKDSEISIDISEQNTYPISFTTYTKKPNQF